MTLTRFSLAIALALSAALVFLSGCGGQSGTELVVGVYGNRDTIEFNESQATKDPESIEEFKRIIAAGEKAQALEHAQEPLKKAPDYIVHINNRDNHTLEIWANLWLQPDGTVVFSQGSEGSEYYSIKQENSKRIKELIGLE